MFYVDSDRVRLNYSEERLKHYISNIKDLRSVYMNIYRERSTIYEKFLNLSI